MLNIMDDYRLNSDIQWSDILTLDHSWHLQSVRALVAVDNTVEVRLHQCQEVSLMRQDSMGMSLFETFFLFEVGATFRAISHPREVLIKHQLVFFRHDFFQHFLQTPCHCMRLDLHVINPGGATILNRLLWVSLRDCEPGGFTVALWLWRCYWGIEWIYNWNSPSSTGSRGAFYSQTDAVEDDNLRHEWMAGALRRQTWISRQSLNNNITTGESSVIFSFDRRS